MAADKQTKLLAKQLFKLSVVDGEVSADRVAGVLDAGVRLRELGRDQVLVEPKQSDGAAG